MSKGEASTMAGRRLEELCTPALAVDLDALEYNLKLMSSFFEGKQAKLRPHFKSHKCVTLAHRQLKAGNAVGITCAKLGEAEALVAGGIKDVLIANQVVGRVKAARLAELNRRALVRCAVDCPQNLVELGEAAEAAGVTIGVLVEVDIGMKRCGVQPGKETLELARLVTKTRGLRFDGLQGYEGHLVMIRDPEERKQKTLGTMDGLVKERRALEGAGIPCAIVSSAGTGTYDVTGSFAGIDEVQAGSYALMDANYKRIRPEFRNALTVVTTVISASADRCVIDVGLKGIGNEFGPPVAVGVKDARIDFASEEHEIIFDFTVPVGTRLSLIPSHGCTTCNLHRRMWAHHGGIIEECWPIEAAGLME